MSICCLRGTGAMDSPREEDPMIYVAVVSKETETAVMIQHTCAVYFRGKGKRVSFYSYGNSYAFLRDWKNGDRDFDIVFLDSRIMDEEGFAAAGEIRKIRPDSAVIFVSDTEDHMREAFRLGAVHYLNLPFGTEEVQEALRRTAQMMENSWRKRVTIKSGTVLRVVELSELEAVVSSDHQQMLFMKDGETVSLRMKLSEAEVQLNERSRFKFVSCCRGVLVNLDEIEEIRAEHVILRSGRILPLAKRRAGEMKRILADFMAAGEAV